MTKKLIITRVSKSFDPLGQEVLGPWCFVGSEDIYPEWENLEFVDAFTDIKQLETEETNCRKLSAVLCTKFGKKLNEKHNKSYSFSFWRLILISWILSSVQGLWTRYRHIERFVEKKKGQTFEVLLAPKSVPEKFTGFLEFQHCQRRSPRFDFWLSSMVLRSIAPENWVLVEPDPKLGWECFIDIPEAKPLRTLEQRSILGALARSLMGRLRFDFVPGTSFSKIPLSLFLSLMPKRADSETNYSFPDETIVQEFPEIFIDLLNTFLEQTIPAAYGVGFKELDNKALKKNYTARRIFIGNYMPTNELRRFEAAHAMERGEKLVSVQHGGGYGIARNNSWVAELEYPLHAFFSWGWLKHGDYRGNFIPLPSPWLSRYENKHKELNNNILMPGTKTDLGDVRPFGPRPKDWISYRKDKLQFIEKLEGSLQDNLFYYPYNRGTTDLLEETYIREKGGQVKLAGSGLNRDMLRCRLLVLDHPGTTLHLSMAANVPTICFWNPKTFYTSEDAERFFNLFREEGILFSSPKAAAEAANKNWNNINCWWESDRVQSVRREWCKSHSRTSKVWWWYWARELFALR